MKKFIKKKKLFFIVLFIFIFIIYFSYYFISESILQDSILKIGLSADKYNSTNLQSDLTNCSLFKEDLSIFQPEVAKTTTVDGNLYISAINNFYFSDGSSVSIEDIKNTYSKYLSFDFKDNLISSTPLTLDTMKKLVLPIIRKDKINTLTCGRYNTLIKNNNEIVLGQNTFYPDTDASTFKKIIIKKVDIEERSESDILSDLVESRLDILINIFNPQKSFSIISKYPKIGLKTLKSQDKAVLLINKNYFSEEEIFSFLSQIDISSVSKIIYNSTIIPLLASDDNNSKLSSNTSNKTNTQPKQIYFSTHSSTSLLRASKIILSKINPLEFTPILQVNNSSSAKDVINSSSKVNVILMDVSSNSELDLLQQQLPSWTIQPLWQYQDLILFNKNLKDFSSIISYTRPELKHKEYL